MEPVINELLVPLNYLRSFTAHENGAANSADSHEWFPHLPPILSREKYKMDADKTVDDWMYFVFFILCFQIMSIQSVFILRLHPVLESL